jgi:hypothetical protein
MERAKPMGRLPQSPIKMEAGRKLYIKKAAEAPIKKRETVRSWKEPSLKCRKAKNTAAMRLIPAHSPSILSKRFTALVIPTIQMMVRIVSPVRDKTH